MTRGRRGRDRPGYMERWKDFEARRREVDQAVAGDTPRSFAPRDPVAPVPVEVLDETPYVELHLHSNYSLLEGASSLDELLTAAREQGHRALALTDHNALYGAMEFARAAKESGLRPISGLELTVSEADGEEDGTRSHITLLAESRQGYSNLCRLSSIAFGLREESDEGKEQRRLDPCVEIGELEHHAGGLIALTGCREGAVGQLLQGGRAGAAEQALRRLVGWFGADNVFVELQDNYVFGDRPRNRALVALAERVGVGVVGTGNVHYHEQARHRLQDVLTAIRHRKTLDECHRERRPNAEFYLRSPQEQARRFAAIHPQAAANSVRIARRCRFDLTADLGYRLPSPRLEDGEESAIEQLGRICRERLGERYGASSRAEREDAEGRLAQELRLVAKHELAGFFLIYHQIFQIAHEVATEIRGPSAGRNQSNLPPGRGRGSSVASIICYLIGLSHIDPVKNKLFIGRFLNEEMHSFPDIDLDFARDIRAALIERVYAVWGKEHAALVATFPSYRLRSAVRDIGKALGLPATELDRIAKGVGPYSHAGETGEELHRSLGSTGRADARGWRDLAELAGQLAGFPRHLSQHPGGMVISSEPLIDYVPCQPAAWKNRYLCHWDKDSIDDARMVKIDFLALGMLSVVEETVDLVERHDGVGLDLTRIDFADADVYDGICRGDTVGVFQIESRAQIAMLPRTQPRNLEDLAVQVSIVRPGPIVGGAVNPYVRRRELQRRDPHYVPEVPHPLVRDVLAETLGVVIYQEQVLLVAEKLAGFTPGEADQFRRAMSRKRSLAAMERYRERFMQGSSERGVPRGVAEQVFENLLGFAEFGFPKSHGTAFALLAYQTTWLKRYYPAAFTCALFNNQPMGFYPPHVLTNDARRHGIELRRPDINISEARCTVEPPGSGRGAVRVGIGYVRGVGEAGGRRVDEERIAAGPFRSLFDFMQRTGLSREATTNLIRIGAFDGFGLNRRELIWQLGLLADGLQRAVLDRPRERQLRLALPTAQDEVALADFSDYQRMAADYELLSLSPDSHPMQFLRAALGEGVASSRHLRAMAGGETVEVAGLVVCRQQPLTARGIIFLLLEDEFGLVNVLVGKQLSERCREAVRTAPFVHVRGVLERRAGEQRTLVAGSLRELVPEQAMRMPGGKSWA